jgi:hypothetical protein
VRLGTDERLAERYNIPDYEAWKAKAS